MSMMTAALTPTWVVTLTIAERRIFMIQHVGSMPDGAVIRFANSAYLYLKVCDKNGRGGIVNLKNGQFTPVSKIYSQLGLSPTKAIFVANSVWEVR